jgi:hypothetical protein
LLKNQKFTENAPPVFFNLEEGTGLFSLGENISRKYFIRDFLALTVNKNKSHKSKLCDANKNSFLFTGRQTLKKILVNKFSFFYLGKRLSSTK